MEHAYKVTQLYIAPCTECSQLKTFKDIQVSANRVSIKKMETF